MDQRLISYELFAVLVEKWPQIMMPLKQKIDENLMLQMDWVTMHFECIRNAIDETTSFQEARERLFKMTD